MGRAERRHKRRRLLNKVLYNKDLAIHNYNNMNVCSCSMCCNVRRNKWLNNRELLSMQERKEEDDYYDQLKEI